MRMGHFSLQPNAKFTEIRRCSLFRFQPLQPRSQPLQTKPLQTKSNRCSHWVALSMSGIRDSFAGLAEPSWNWCDCNLMFNGTPAGSGQRRRKPPALDVGCSHSTFSSKVSGDNRPFLPVQTAHNAVMPNSPDAFVMGIRFDALLSQPRLTVTHCLPQQRPDYFR